MPIDKYRFTAPEDTQFVPLNYKGTIPITQSENASIKQFSLDQDGKRLDGRLVHEQRPIFMSTGIVSQANGSSYLERNNTKVMCAVYGPREPTRQRDFSDKGELQCEVMYTPFASPLQQRKSGGGMRMEKDISMQIRTAIESIIILDKYPKSTIDVFITVLQDDGAVLSSAITCASLALADAGIEMYELISAAEVAVQADLENVVVDPTANESLVIGTSVCIAYRPSTNAITLLLQSGDLPYRLSVSAIQSCVASCNQMIPLMTNSLKRSKLMK